MAVDHRTLVEQAFQALGQRNLEAVEKIHAPNQHAAIRSFGAMAFTAFPDLQLKLDDVISAGDKVVTRWTATGTHKGDTNHPMLGHVPASGKPVRVSGITIHQVTNGQIVQSWGATDSFRALFEVGLLRKQG
jgi:predicted ester cyclase